DAAQLPSADPAAFAERKFIERGDARLVLDVQRGGSPVAANVVPIHHHLRLVVCLGAGQPGIDVEILRPRVIPAELEAARQAAGYVDLQGVVAGVAFREPEEAAGKIRIWARCDRDVLRALGDRAAGRSGCSAGNAGRRRADLGGDAVGIDAEESVIAERTEVGEAHG